MIRFFSVVMALAALPVSAVVQAKSPTELFESVSSSIVVVHGMDNQGKPQSLGSGVVLSKDEIVTNCHVIEKSATLSVEHRGREYSATLKHSDYDHDVCSLNVTGFDAPAAVLGSTKPLKVGQKVFAIGAPQGLELTLSEGIISSLREVTGGRYLQISAPISPGSSGGGLFDEEGRLIGLPTFYLGGGQQLNFAVPVEWIKALPQRSTKPTAQPAISWLNKALELEGEKDWPGLLKHAQAWTRAQSQDSMAWYSLGFAYGQAGQTTKAIEAFQQALRINPEQAEAWNNLGVVYRQAGQTAKAIEAFQQALRINPEHAKAWNNLGVAYRNAGQTTKEIEAYQQALRINPEQAEAWNDLGIAYGQAGQTTKAIEAFQQALRINPEQAEAWNNLGVAYGQAGQTAKAIEAYLQALRINPEYAHAWNNLGVAYRQAGQTSKVMEAHRQLKRLDPALADEFFNKTVLP
ncbi:MAG: serine protease [Immundisolibacter sp.]|uniref:tetratricopeptide repeat-containing S1 family peptidase n=1 Tax=Immundisolibacter sp. TaxID=1934948 RepID=UPI0019A613C0|nr:tetratricopeptide repeat-containing serine protease family protein [Immundisolibacter sp.]MBC7162892.1 serine protease [Immundisolibacter sp.]